MGYIDGHFLPYYGMYPITKGWHGVRKIPMKGSYNFIGVDAKFIPWIFLVRSSSEDLLQKIPEMMERAKKIGSDIGLSEQEIDELILDYISLLMVEIEKIKSAGPYLSAGQSIPTSG